MPDGDGPTIPEYRLRLSLDADHLRWEGTVEFDPPSGGGPLTLDCEGPKVLAVRHGGAPTAFNQAPSNGAVTVELGRGAPGPVAIDFTGEVETQNLFGLYRSRHGTGSLLTTHCEPTGARKIFPCQDRPDRKARIALTVRAPTDLDVVANSPPRRVGAVDGGREWSFEPTPTMSTYLFYLGVGRFDYREDRSGAVALRVATAPDRGSAADWALRSAGRILRAYEEYYGIPYPLPKLDLIAVTEHAFGAMENWGAISFQESRLLVDRASSTFATHDVFTTSAHEIAHQWFGNLVTMRWWDDIWLNESFAALMETKVTAQLEPTFDPWDDFLLRRAGKAEALDGDSLRSTHPVRARVERPDELSQIFDEISYGKGSSVLAMLDHYLGEDRFRAGVTEYLQTFRYGNARTEDLFASLERASGEPVRSLAGPWIDRAGLPVVVARSDDGGVTLSQRRFAYLDAPDEPPWPIPMVVEVGGRRERLLFDRREHRLTAPAGGTVLLNPGSVGFYRVLYDRPLLDRLLEVLPAREGLDGWSVVDDLAAFVQSGDIPWAAYARAVEAFADTPHRAVVETLAGSLAAFALQYPNVDAVARTAGRYLARQTERVGVDRRPGEPAGTGILRDRLAFARVRVDRDFAEALAPRFAAWDSLDPDLRAAVAIARVRTGGPAGFDAVREALRRTRSDSDASRLVRGLAWTEDPTRLRAILDEAAAGGINRSHLVFLAIQSAANPRGRDVSWAWLREHLDGIATTFRGSGYLPLLLEYTLPLLGRGRAAELRTFFEGHAVPEGTRGLAKGLERLEIAERLAARLT